MALDLPGHGLPSGTAVPFSSYPAAIGAAWDHCGIERPVVVGLSMGAPVGLAFPARRPRRVQSLTIVNTFLALVPRTAAPDSPSTTSCSARARAPVGGVAARLWG
ncbi:alpha/beta fold hydrolase [Actinacidiphila glaucinigra]|uniref:alpha/beta fold hydrolase n=1 Tax=Streptomycetaceae TaxID=2062 RepID=UPI00370DCE9E